MKKYLVIFALLFVALATPNLARADLTYDVNFNVGPDTITGTIVTNGGTGVIEFGSFQFGISRTSATGGGGGTTAGKEDSTGEIVITGDAFTATVSGLFFNFDSIDPSTLEFLDANDNFVLCLFTDEGCDPPGSGEILTQGDTTLTITGLSGNQMIASIAPTPEPGTFGLMLISIVGLVFWARRRSTQGLRLDAG
jgi:PEP-CTERM motif